MAGELIPLWIKILYTLILCVLVPVYWVHWGPKNFLWFSDIALLATAVALWLESSLLASMMALAIALPELAWNADFFGRLVSGRHVLGLSEYMFDARKPLYLRALSLFHVALPVLLLFIDSATIPGPGPGSKPQTWIGPRAYLAVVMLFFPLVIYLPTHFLLRALFGSR